MTDDYNELLPIFNQDIIENILNQTYPFEREELYKIEHIAHNIKSLLDEELPYKKGWFQSESDILAETTDFIYYLFNHKVIPYEAYRRISSIGYPHRSWSIYFDLETMSSSDKSIADRAKYFHFQLAQLAAILHECKGYLEKYKILMSISFEPFTGRHNNPLVYEFNKEFTKLVWEYEKYDYNLEEHLRSRN